MNPQHLCDIETSSTDRDALLALLDETIHDVRDRIQFYEVESPADERLLIKWHRTLATLIGQYRQLTTYLKYQLCRQKQHSSWRAEDPSEDELERAQARVETIRTLVASLNRNRWKNLRYD